MRWNNLAEHTVYENQWLTVNLADVELPDGRHLAHFLIRQRPVALCAVVNPENEVLLLWRHRFITDTWAGSYPPAWSKMTKPPNRPPHGRRSRRRAGGPAPWNT
jgi:hypothetical protein